MEVKGEGEGGTGCAIVWSKEPWTRSVYFSGLVFEPQFSPLKNGANLIEEQCCGDLNNFAR